MDNILTDWGQGSWRNGGLINFIHLFNTCNVSTCDCQFCIAQSTVSQNLYVKGDISYSFSATVRTWISAWAVWVSPFGRSEAKIDRFTYRNWTYLKNMNKIKTLPNVEIWISGGGWHSNGYSSTRAGANSFVVFVSLAVNKSNHWNDNKKCFYVIQIFLWFSFSHDRISERTEKI